VHLIQRRNGVDVVGDEAERLGGQRGAGRKQAKEENGKK
jgi:hypothetical protein